MKAVEVGRHTQHRLTLDLTDAPDITWAGGITVAPEQAHIQYLEGEPTVVFVTGTQTKGTGVRDGGVMSNCWRIAEAPDWVRELVAEVS